MGLCPVGEEEEVSGPGATSSPLGRAGIPAASRSSSQHQRACTPAAGPAPGPCPPAVSVRSGADRRRDAGAVAGALGAEAADVGHAERRLGGGRHPNPEPAADASELRAQMAADEGPPHVTRRLPAGGTLAGDEARRER